MFRHKFDDPQLRRSCQLAKAWLLLTSIRQAKSTASAICRRNSKGPTKELQTNDCNKVKCCPAKATTCFHWQEWRKIGPPTRGLTEHLIASALRGNPQYRKWRAFQTCWYRQPPIFSSIVDVGDLFEYIATLHWSDFDDTRSLYYSKKNSYWHVCVPMKHYPNTSYTDDLRLRLCNRFRLLHHMLPLKHRSSWSETHVVRSGIATPQCDQTV